MLQNNTPAQPGLGGSCLATDSYIGRAVNQSSRVHLKHSDGEFEELEEELTSGLASSLGPRAQHYLQGDFLLHYKF